MKQTNFGYFIAALLFLLILYNVSELKGLFLAISGAFVLGLCAVNLLQALGLLVFAIALSPEIQMLGIPIRIEDLVIPVILFFWIIRLGSRGTNLKPTTLRLPIVVFLFFMLISTVNASILNDQINQLIAFFHFFKHIEYFVIFLLAFNIADSGDDIRFLMFCLFGAAIVLALQSIYSPVGFLGALSGVTTPGASPGEVAKGVSRLKGVATETPNIFGGFLVFHAVVMIAFMLEESSINMQLLYLGGFTILLFPLLFTMSRSSYAGLAAGLVFLGVFREPRLLLIMLLGAFAVGSIVPDDVISRFLTIFTAMVNVDLTPSWQARLRAWQFYLPTIIRNPFIGKGLFYISPGEVDNELVLRAVETGVLGALSFVWVFWSFVKRAYFVFREGTQKVFRQLGLGYTAGIVAMSVHSLAAASFTTIRTAEPIYFVSGLVLAAFLQRLNITRQHTNIDITANLRKIQHERTNRRRIDRGSYQQPQP